MNNVEVSIANWQHDNVVLRALREEVFIIEQKVPPEEEWDELDDDPTTVHLKAFDGDLVVGTLRLIHNVKIGRVCVKASHRGQGIASQLLLRAMLIGLAKIPLEQAVIFKLSAQLSAMNVYRRAGFKEYGDVYLDAGIEHKDMKLELNSRDDVIALFSDNVFRFSTPQEAELYLCAALRFAKQEAYGLNYSLNPALYGTHQIARMVSQLARHSRYSDVRFLIRDEKESVGNRHELIALYQRLPSKIQLRKSLLEAKSQQEAFLTLDGTMLVYFNDEANTQGFVNFQARAECKKLREHFTYLWQSHSVEIEEFKQLGL